MSISSLQQNDVGSQVPFQSQTLDRSASEHHLTSENNTKCSCVKFFTFAQEFSLHPITMFPPLASCSSCIRFHTLMLAYKAKTGPVRTYLKILYVTLSSLHYASSDPPVPLDCPDPTVRLQGRYSSSVLRFWQLNC